MFLHLSLWLNCSIVDCCPVSESVLDICCVFLVNGTRKKLRLVPFPADALKNRDSKKSRFGRWSSMMPALILLHDSRIPNGSWTHEVFEYIGFTSIGYGDVLSAPDTKVQHHC